MNKIILKHSVVPGRIPAPEDLEIGEVAVNATDGSLFIRKKDGSVVEFQPVENPTISRLNFYLFTGLSVTWSIITIALLTFALIDYLK
jgi:hypothetical protein